MIDAALVARVRTEVASGLDPATLLALYADPARRRLIRERVRAAAGTRLTDPELERLCADLFGFGCLQPLLDEWDRAIQDGSPGRRDSSEECEIAVDTKTA